MKVRNAALMICPGRVGGSIHAGRALLAAIRGTTAVATSVNPLFAKALGDCICHHDQQRAEDTPHQADGRGETPVTTLNAAEVNERVQDFGCLRTQRASLEVVLLEANRQRGA